MKAAIYNERELAAGRITGSHIEAVTRHWQETSPFHGTKDGKLGPITRGHLAGETEFADTPVEIPDPRLTLGLRALGFAVGELGNGEIGSNNRGSHVERYHLATGGTSGPWCSALVAYCFKHAAAAAGVDLPFKVSANAKRQFRRACKAGELVTVPRPGDIACWHRGAFGSRKGHTGIVKAVDGNLFFCVEGNKGKFPSECDIFKHSLGEGSLIGFARV